MSSSKSTILKASSGVEGTLIFVTLYVHTHLLDEFLSKLRIIVDKATAEPEMISFNISLEPVVEPSVEENGTSSGGVTAVKMVEGWNATRDWIFANQVQKDYIQELYPQLEPYFAKPQTFSRIIHTYLLPGSPEFNIPRAWGNPHWTESFGSVYGDHFVLTSLCRSWRRAIIEDQALRTELNESFLRLAPELPKRSGTAPLSISLRRSDECPAESVEQIVTTITKQFSRVKRLRLFLGYNPNQRDSPLWEPATTLIHYDLFDGVVDPPPDSTLFGGSALRLTALNLSHVEFSWDLPVFNSLPLLESLSVPNPARRPTKQQLSTILGSTPRLRYLALKKALPPRLDASLIHQVVELPKLTVLIIKGFSQECHEFLSWVEANHAKAFQISCTDDPQEDAHLVLQSDIVNISRIQDQWGVISDLWLSSTRQQGDVLYSSHYRYKSLDSGILCPTIVLECRRPR
ncbi:hypothetical protein AX16_010745 [Volvariella volvacea WC 439]|nr:hypothetical protein AX16_010745 [Volvariella volvacea WC 439]